MGNKFRIYFPVALFENMGVVFHFFLLGSCGLTRIPHGQGSDCYYGEKNNRGGVSWSDTPEFFYKILLDFLKQVLKIIFIEFVGLATEFTMNFSSALAHH